MILEYTVFVKSSEIAEKIFGRTSIKIGHFISRNRVSKKAAPSKFLIVRNVLFSAALIRIRLL